MLGNAGFKPKISSSLPDRVARTRCDKWEQVLAGSVAGPDDVRLCSMLGLC